MKLTVVLGQKLNNDGTMTNELINRLNIGIKLFSATNSNYIAVCGGITNKKAGRSEAVTMKEYLTSKGIPEDKIIVEDKSRNTLGSAKELKKIVKGMEKVDVMHLISNRYHFERVFGNCHFIFKRNFRKANIINCESGR